MARQKSSLSIPTLSHTTPTRGFLVIGDPHIWSHKPGRRRDDSYLDTLLGKLAFAATQANARDLWPLILGDLLHESTDNNLIMLSRLSQTLQLFRRKPIVLVGNHDKNQNVLTPGTALHLLHTTDQIKAIIDNGPYARFDMLSEEGSVRVLLGGTPYGEPIPKSLAGWVTGPAGNTKTADDIRANLQADQIVWVTHDDLAFDTSYPGATTLFPILGVDTAINGHMHRAQKPMMKGETAWYNPGNISRNTIDLIEQIPRVWVWNAREKETEIGADGLMVPKLHPVDIPHAPGTQAFSLEGRITALDDMKKVVIAKGALAEEDTTLGTESEAIASRFVELSRQDEHVGRTDDGAYLVDSIAQEAESLGSPAAAREIVQRLFQSALLTHREKK